MALGKVLRSTIELAGTLDPSLRNAIDDAIKLIEDLNDETLESVDAASHLIAEMSLQEDLLKNLKKAYAAYVIQGEENSEQAKELAKNIRDIDNELEANRSVLKAAERATNNLTDAQDDAADSAKHSAEGYTTLKDVMADFISDTLREGSEAFRELATECDAALSMLEARTGGSAEQMKAFEDVLHEVYSSNYGENLGDVSEVLSEVIQMTDDLDNASLAEITKGVISLRDVFGFDPKDSLRAVNSLMDQFDLAADEAFNLIVQGAQNGLNQNGDLLDTINEYAVQFRTAGFSAENMFNMLHNGAESGTWSIDKLGDAVKEFNIRMSDGTAAEYLTLLGANAEVIIDGFNRGGSEAKRAMSEAMTAILECRDATLQYQAGVGLFGTMWEDLGADTVVSLMDTDGAIRSVINSMEQMDESARDTLDSSLEQLGRTIRYEIAQPIVDELLPGVKKTVDFADSKVAPTVAWMRGHLPEIGIALGTIGSVLGAMNWQKTVTSVGKVISSFKGIGASIAAIPAPVLAVIAIVAALAAGFVYLWKTNEDFRDRAIEIWNELESSFEGLGSTLGNTLNELTPLLLQLATLFGDTLGQAAEIAIPIVVELLALLLPALSQLSEILIALASDLLMLLLPIIVQIADIALPALVNIISILMPLLDMALALLGPILDMAVEIAPVIIDMSMTALEPLIGLLLSLLPVLKACEPIILIITELLAEGLGNTLRSIIPSIQGLTRILSGLVAFISGVFSGDWNKAWSGIVDIFGGIWNSLVAFAKMPLNELIRLVNMAIGGINKISIDIPDWVPGIGGKEFGFDIPTIPMLAKGGFTDGISIAGEEAMEAVISFNPAYRDKNIGIWEQAGKLLGLYKAEKHSPSLTSKAGELLSLSDFSLGSLADGTHVVVYYDFSGLTWSPQFHTEGSASEEDIMAKLRAHEAEFFEWLEEFIRMREVSEYA